jgi:hypothetical protein
MRPSRNLLFVIACLLLVAGILVSTSQEVSALAPLSFSWFCSDSTVCDFAVTSNNHAMYKWNFGDGSFHGPTTSREASHDYDFSGAEHSYTVYLIGYATNPPGSADNIVGCTVVAQGPGPGGNPGASGNCSG